MQGKKSIVVANAPMSFVQNIIPKFLHSYLSKEFFKWSWFLICKYSTWNES